MKVKEIQKRIDETDQRHVELNDRIVDDRKEIIETVVESAEKTNEHVTQLSQVADAVNGFINSLGSKGVSPGYIKDNAELIRDVFFYAAKRYEDDRKAKEEAAATEEASGKKEDKGKAADEE